MTEQWERAAMMSALDQIGREVRLGRVQAVKLLAASDDGLLDLVAGAPAPLRLLNSLITPGQRPS